MKDIVLMILVLGISLGALIGVAYWVQKRNKKTIITEFIQPTDSIGKIWIWWQRLSAILLALLVIAGIVFSNLTFLWIGLFLLLIRLALGYIYRINRLNKIIKPKK